MLRKETIRNLTIMYKNTLANLKKYKNKDLFKWYHYYRNHVLETPDDYYPPRYYPEEEPYFQRPSR